MQSKCKITSRKTEIEKFIIPSIDINPYFAESTDFHYLIGLKDTKDPASGM